MPTYRPIQESFASGEISPKAYGRVQLQRYAIASKKLKDFFNQPQGGVIRRSGTRYVASVKTSADKTRILPFRFSTDQAYVLEFGNQYIRFFSNEGQVQIPTLTVTNATNSSGLIRITTSTNHNLATNTRVTIAGVGGVTNANGTWVITRISDTTFDLISSTFAGSYTSGGTVSGVLEIVSPYTSAQVFSIGFAQSADVFYLVHPSHAPRKLKRLSSTRWEIEIIDFYDGAYLDENTTSTTIVTNNPTGNVVLTASSAIFASTDVGRLIRLRSAGANTESSTTKPVSSVTSDGGGTPLVRLQVIEHGFKTGDRVEITGVGGVNANGVWYVTVIDSQYFTIPVPWAGTYSGGGEVKLKYTIGHAKIITYNSATSVDATVIEALPTTATTNWRLGAWSATTSYPSCVTFHEERLVFAGSSTQPQTIWMSRSGDYENFAPTETNDAVVDDNAVTYTIASNDVNSIKWLVSSTYLMIGTAGGEWIARSSRQGEPITPDNITVKQETALGSTLNRASKVNGAVLYVQRSGEKLRELAYNFDIDQFQSKDVSILAEHLLSVSPIVDFAYASEPYNLWLGVRDDGIITSLTYMREQDTIAWSLIQVGGSFESGNAVVESIAVIPTPDGSQDQAWVIVKRTINGSTVRYVEFFEESFKPKDKHDKEFMFFVDSGLTYNVPLTITDITDTATVTVTSATHGLSNGDKVRIINVKGKTELNHRTFEVENVTTNTFDLKGVDGTNYGVYYSGGTAHKLVSTISGLSHLEGATLQVLADGSARPEVTVSSGSVTLSKPAGIVSLGLPYNSDLSTLRFEGGGKAGTAQGKTKRINEFTLRVDNSIYFKYGTDENSLNSEMVFRESNDAMDNSPPLFSGDKGVPFNSDYTKDGWIFIRQDKPYPLNILSIMPDMVVYE